MLVKIFIVRFLNHLLSFPFFVLVQEFVFFQQTAEDR